MNGEDVALEAKIKVLRRPDGYKCFGCVTAAHCCASSTTRSDTRSGDGAEWRETRLQLSVPEATTRSDASFARFHSGAAGLQGMGRMPTEHNLGWEWGLYE